MIEPVTTAAAVIGCHRLMAAAKWVYLRRADTRVELELIQASLMLPAGSEISKIRADGSRWCVRVPATLHR